MSSSSTNSTSSSSSTSEHEEEIRDLDDDLIHSDEDEEEEDGYHEDGDNNNEDEDSEGRGGGDNHDEDGSMIDNDEYMMSDDHLNHHPDFVTLVTPQEKTKKKPGIIYLSSIPPGFNVSRTTSFFANFGKVGRVFLQPDLKEKNRDKGRTFTEGWVEFMSKRVAQEVADNLNTSQVGGKKRSKSHDVIWNIKYLPRFKWSHLTERLNYEKAVHHQKMRNEITQAKREADFYKASLDKSKRMRRSDGGDTPIRTYDFRLKDTEETIRTSKRKRGSSLSSETTTASKRSKQESTPTTMTTRKGAGNRKNKGKGKSSRSDFLRSVFGGGSD